MVRFDRALPERSIGERVHERRRGLCAQVDPQGSGPFRSIDEPNLSRLRPCQARACRDYVRVSMSRTPLPAGPQRCRRADRRATRSSPRQSRASWRQLRQCGSPEACCWLHRRSMSSSAIRLAIEWAWSIPRGVRGEACLATISRSIRRKLTRPSTPRQAPVHWARNAG
jgi:hypothetical protein